MTTTDTDEEYDPVEAYKQRFGDLPTLIGLPEARWDEAMRLLALAVETDEGFDADFAEFYELLGMHQPTSDMII